MGGEFRTGPDLRVLAHHGVILDGGEVAHGGIAPEDGAFSDPGVRAYGGT